MSLTNRGKNVIAGGVLLASAAGVAVPAYAAISKPSFDSRMTKPVTEKFADGEDLQGNSMPNGTVTLSFDADKKIVASVLSPKALGSKPQVEVEYNGNKCTFDLKVVSSEEIAAGTRTELETKSTGVRGPDVNVRFLPNTPELSPVSTVLDAPTQSRAACIEQ